MPTYLYRCEEGHEFEVQQKIKDEPLKTCDECKGVEDYRPCGAKLKRLINNEGGFVLKGGGWTPKNYR
jgi:putative FmdB family regulatory protein